MTKVTVRVYGPLNDFLPPGRQQASFAHAFEGRESVKDLVEGLGIPHPEIDLILVNGEPVAFDYVVQDGNRIAVFPRFESVNIESRLEPRTRQYYQRFHECPGCHRIYWAGSHWQRLTRLVERTRLEADTCVS